MWMNEIDYIETTFSSKKNGTIHDSISVQLRFNPFAEMLGAWIDGRNASLSTWDAPGYDADLVEWERFSIFFRDRQHQRAATVTLTAGLIKNTTSTHYHFTNLFFRSENVEFSKDLFANFVINNGHLNLFQNWWLLAIFTYDHGTNRQF